MGYVFIVVEPWVKGTVILLHPGFQWLSDTASQAVPFCSNVRNLEWQHFSEWCVGAAAESGQQDVAVASLAGQLRALGRLQAARRTLPTSRPPGSALCTQAVLTWPRPPTGWLFVFACISLLLFLSFYVCGSTFCSAW